MQRIGNRGFTIVESASALQGGNTVELYKLPNGSWVFGKGENARLVKSADEVIMFGEGIQAKVSTWLARQAELAAVAAERAAQGIPEDVVAGPRPDTKADTLARAIMSLSPDAVDRMLAMIQSVVMPQADSLLAGQEAAVNPHEPFSPQVGQDAVRMEIPDGFPEGSIWSNPSDPSAGILVPTGQVDHKNQPIREWRMSPEFERFVERKQDGGSLDTAKVTYAPPTDKAAGPGKRAQRSMGAKALAR